MSEAKPCVASVTLRAEAAGSNPASRPPRFYFGLDCVAIFDP